MNKALFTWHGHLARANPVLLGFVLFATFFSPAFAADNKTQVALLPGDVRVIPANKYDQVKDLTARAFVEEKLGNYPEALKLYTMALSAAPGQPYLLKCLDRLSHAIYGRGEHDFDGLRAHDVEEAMRRSEVTGFRKDAVEAISLEGHRLLRQGLALEAADKFYQSLVKEKNNLSAQDGLERTKRRISSRLKKGRFESPQEFAAYQGMDRYMEGDWLGAIEALERAIKMGPLEGELASSHLPDYAAQARTNINREIWKSERAGIMKQARALYNDGRWLDAEPLFKRIMDADPTDEEAKGLADVVFKKAAEARAQQAEEARRKDLDETLIQMRKSAKEGDSMTTLESCAHALDLDPQNAEALGFLKASQERLRKQGFVAPEVAVQDAAEEAYKRALLHYGMDELNDALASVKEALRANPNHAEAKALLEKLTNKEKPDAPPPDKE
jgi:tetratricopeptide (TPR) repeat protein